MLITRVELTDFKSYVQQSVTFPPGTNAIVGANGSGKSSLLEAIGFALFDFHDDAIGSYLREGARDGTVIVGLISSLDEREYEVERRFGRGARYRIHDIALQRQCIAEGSADVATWLRQHLCVDGSVDLPTLFRNTVGVPQGTVTSAFLGTAAERKSIFDPLLQVAEYDKAWSNLAETARHLSDQRNTIQTEMAYLTGQTERLPGLDAEHAALDADLSSLATQIETLETTLRGIQAEWELLNAQAEQVRGLAQQVEALHTRHLAHERLVQSAEHELQEAEAAAERVAASQGGHAAYLAAEQTLSTLEQQRATRDRLRAEHATLETQLAQLTTRLEQAERGLQESAAAAQRLAELAPLVAQQALLEERLVAARENAHSLAEAQRRLATADDELARAQHEADNAAAAHLQADTLERALSAHDAELLALQQARQTLIARESAHQAESARLREQSETLAGVDTARCPVCEGELTPQHRAELLERNAVQARELVAALEALAQEQRASKQREDALSAQRKQAERQLRTLPSAEDVARANAALERRSDARASALAAVQALQAAPQRLSEALAALEQLGDPRQQAARHQALADRQAALLREQALALGEQNRVAETRAALDDQLAAYGALDDDMRAARAERDHHSAAHEAYLSNQRAAEQRDARAEHAQACALELAALQTQLDASRTQHAAALAAYDAERHARIGDQLNTTRGSLAALGAQQQAQRKRLSAVAQEIATLQAMQVKLGEQEAALHEVEGLHTLVGRVRELLKQAGPEITRQRVRRISLTASTLHAEIMGDHRNRLIWSEDYALTLDVKGQARPFRQFSGGEQMAAALALRLALLRETSQVDVAFFDEPTAHLDPERRGNLAEQIMQVKGFGQLFVISHDDSFEQLAQNHVRIVKDERGSRWERD